MDLKTAELPRVAALKPRVVVVQSLPSALQKRVTHIVTPCRTPTLTSPLEFALTKNASANPLECAVAKSLDLKCLGMSIYETRTGVNFFFY